MAHTASDHAKIILAGCIPDRRDRLDFALRYLQPMHFPEREQATMFEFLRRYMESYGQVLSRLALDSMLSVANADSGKVAYYTELFDLFASVTVPEDIFRWSVDEIREMFASKQVSEAITQGMEILNHGAKDARGGTLLGHRDAKRHVITRFSQIDRDLQQEEAPEGDMREEGAEILAEYAQAKADRLTGRSQGLMFGIPALDAYLGGGLQPADLGLITGFTSAGKSSLLVALAHHVCVAQGKNVIIATSETGRSQIQRKIIARHSRQPQFHDDLPDGINSSWLRNGDVPEHLEGKLEDVVNDFWHNPSYGHCYVAQVPRGATIDHVESLFIRVNRQFEIHLGAMDYLQLLRAHRNRDSTREEQSLVVKEAKTMAQSFDGGRGIALVSPWQVNRTWRDKARLTGRYTLESLSETAESSNSSDVVISMLEPEDAHGRYVDIVAQVLKLRDGERPGGAIDLNADFATCYFGGRQLQTMDELVGSSSALDESLLMG